MRKNHMKVIVELLSFLVFMCVLVSCTQNSVHYSSYSFISQSDVKNINDFIAWRKQNNSIKKTIISMRENYSHPSDKDSGIEVTGILAEYFNFLTTCQPNNSKLWDSPLAVVFGDIYIESRHYMWSTMSDIGETETKSTYPFPLHYEILGSLNPSFFGSDESRKQSLVSFNKRWNEIMEVLIYTIENHAP